MRIPGLDGQGDLEEVNEVLVGERTEMRGKVMGDGLENHGGRMGEADQALIDVLKIWVLVTAGLPRSSPGSLCLLGNSPKASVSNVHSSWGNFDIHIDSLFILFLFGHSLRKC